MADRSNPFVKLEKQKDLSKWLLYTGLFVLSYFLFYILTIRPSTDISIHATWAAEGDFLHPTSFLRHFAHPLWHVLVRLGMLLGLSLPAASALVTALAKTAEVVIMHKLLTMYLKEHVSTGMITVLTFVCACVSTLCIPFYNPRVYWASFGEGLGLGTPNTWHSCTQMMAMPFMMLAVPYTAHLYDWFLEKLPQTNEKTMLPWKKPIFLGILLFFSLLAKPTFMQAFLPAACLFFLVQWIRHPKNSRYFLQIIVCILPAVLFMIVQYLYYFGIIVPYQSSMILQISADKAAGLLIRLLLMAAFPIYTLFCCRKKGENETFFTLTDVFCLVAVIEFLILGEDGRRAADGNFGWGMIGALLMFWVVCMIRFFKNGLSVRKTNGKVSAVRITGYVLLGWHFLSGLYYIVYLFLTSNPL